MRKKGKIAVVVIVTLLIAGSAVAYFMWNKPRRNIENEKGIAVTATQLVKDFQENETAANEKYLDKAIEVTGTVTEVSQNQDGNTTIMLASGDDFAGVYTTLKEPATNVSIGNNVTIKGKCNGMLSDVRLSEAVLVTK
ncbi:OB-fold protein [Aridibaculum aurantiacum]|uniref:OB-fold protein n=1 Tax=Aridibaculum aurantiacum TaxID=2810307 RepID=UPI001A9653A0|nr:hypothetical protein [Aridibaculum aurantiacum]